jgi:hypothetical protein
VVVFDPHRAGHETTYHPGETNMLMADIAVINKVDSADPRGCRHVVKPPLPKMPPTPDRSGRLPGRRKRGQHAGKRVLVVEDGPTLTHGEMTFGAGVIAARRYGAAEIIDPAPMLVGSLRRNLPKVSPYRRGPAGHGIRSPAGKDLEAPSMPPIATGGVGHAHRPHPAGQDRQTDPQGALRISGQREPTLKALIQCGCL